MAAGSKRTALITGASGGLGYEFAKLFAQDGFNLVLVARSEEKLNEIAAELSAPHKIHVKVIAKDLGAPLAPQQIAKELQADNIAGDALANNAGFAAYGYFHETSVGAQLEMMQVNMVALTHLTKLFLPGMRSRGYGRILNVASTAAFQPGPLMTVYYATKAYVLSFSQALAAEVQGTGVNVTALCPGPTVSGFQKRAAMEDSKLVQSGLMRADAVADMGYKAVMSGKEMVIPGFRNNLLAIATRFLPRGMAARLAMNAQARVGH